MRVAETIEIRRSPAEIWAFVADHGNDPAWCKKVKSAEALGPRAWRLVHKPVPLRPEATLMVEQLELDPPWRLRLREEDDASVFEVEYRLEAISTGTRLTQTSDFEWKTLPRFLHKAFARGVQRDVTSQLRTLKSRFDSAASPTARTIAPGMPGAFAGLSGSRRRGACWLLVIAGSVQLRAFLTFERQMKRTGGPGIISFELAGTTARAREIVRTWGEPGRSAARKSLLLDYLFPPTYAMLHALACEATAERVAQQGRRLFARAGPVISCAQLAAAAFDYVENTALLLTLSGRDQRAPRVARRAALTKFALISLGQAYILLGALDRTRARADSGEDKAWEGDRCTDGS